MGIIRKLKNMRLEVYIAIFITFMACFTRLSMAAGQISYVLAIVLSLVLLYKQRHTLEIPDYVKRYAKAYGIMLLCLLPAALLTGNPGKGFPEFINVWLWRIPVFLVISLCIKKKSILTNMLATFFVVFGIDCLVAFAQYLHGIQRAWGFGSSPLTIAGIMVMLIPVIVVILWDEAFSKKLKCSALFSLFCIFFGMYGNQSRGSWLFSMILVPLFSLKYMLKNVKYFLLVLVVMGGVIGIFASQPQYVARFHSITNTTTDGSNLGRFDVWASAINMFEDHKLMGVGIKQWTTYYEEAYRLPTENQHLYHAHNNFFQLLSETGILGFIGVVGFYLFFGIDTFRNWLKDKNPYDLCVCGTLIGYVFIFGQIEYTLDNSSGMRILWFVIAILLQLKRVNIAGKKLEIKTENKIEN